jgi:hypothetical protein
MTSAGSPWKGGGRILQQTDPLGCKQVLTAILRQVFFCDVLDGIGNPLANTSEGMGNCLALCLD